MEKTHSRKQHTTCKALQFRKLVGNEIKDLEDNGWKFCGTISSGYIVSRQYIHERNKKNMRLDIDFSNLACAVYVKDHLKKIITV